MFGYRPKPQLYKLKTDRDYVRSSWPNSSYILDQDVRILVVNGKHSDSNEWESFSIYCEERRSYVRTSDPRTLQT